MNYSCFRLGTLAGDFSHIQEVRSQISSFGLKAETVFVSNLLAIHETVEAKFSLRFGLKLKTGI